jgi:hypothetical protein
MLESVRHTVEVPDVSEPVTVNSNDRPPTSSPPLAGPLGFVFNGAAFVMFIVALWRGSERTGELDSILWVALAWFVVLLAWLFRVMVSAAGSRGAAHPVRAFVSWGLAPLLFAGAAVLVFGGYAFDARFELSRGALDQAAQDALAGHAPGAGWIGLYPVNGFIVDGRSVRIGVDGQQAFVRDAPPTDLGSSPVWYDRFDAQWSLEVAASGD